MAALQAVLRSTTLLTRLPGRGPTSLPLFFLPLDVALGPGRRGCLRLRADTPPGIESELLLIGPLIHGQ